MDKANEKHIQMLKTLNDKLFKAERDVAAVLRFSDIYESFAINFTTYVSPYIWIIPLTVMIIVVVTFKRAKLFGVTQKLLAFALTMDMFFTLFTGIRDGLLNFLNMNYGFVEYKVCRFILVSFGIQNIIHGSSLLLKSFMMARIVLLFAFPMKFKHFRLKKWIALISLIHVIVCSFSISNVVMVSIIPVTTVQEYKHGEPLKIIQACELNSHDPYSTTHASSAYIITMFVVHVLYFSLIPIMFHCVGIVVLSILLKKQIKAVMNLLSDVRQKSVIKYLRLMKVSLLLSISFLIQEIPQVITQVYGTSADLDSISRFNSFSYVLMSISFAFGKPADLLIYANQSKSFRTTLLKWIFRNKQS